MTTYFAARLQAMDELERMHDGPIPNRAREIEALTRWYMLPECERWRHHARLHAKQVRLAIRAKDRAWYADSLARCRNAVARWRAMKPRAAIAPTQGR